MLARARNTGLERADRAAAQAGRLFVGKAAGSHQHESFACLGAQFPEFARKFFQGQCRFWIVDGRQRLGIFVADRLRPPTKRPQVGVETITHDGEQPAFEVGARCELLLLIERREDRVLDEIVGSFPFAAHETRESAKIGEKGDYVVFHRCQCGEPRDQRKGKTTAATTHRSRSLADADGDAPRSQQEIVMNWDRIEGNWKQVSGKIKEQWGKLTEDDITVIAGKQDQLVGRIQERYGVAKDEAENQVKNWMGRM